MEYLKTVNDLKQYCKNNNITGFSKKSKPELITLVSSFITNTPTDNTTENSNTLKFIDLFCGIGGFHQAFNQLTYSSKCVLACDIDKHCQTVYENNYNMKPHGDVKQLDESTLPDFDIICAGFPCQPFSNGGKKKTFDDDRGLLFDEIIRIANIKKPRFMFLENVKHILKVSDGEVLEYIKNKIKKSDYHLQIFQISPHNYGIPQQRERVYFVCVRNDIHLAGSEDTRNPIELPECKSTSIYIENYLDPMDKIDEKYFISNDILNVLDAWDEMIQKMEEGEKLSPTIMINDAYRSYTEDEFKKFATWRQDYITKNKPLLQKYKTEFDEWHLKHKELLKKREIYAKLEWQTGVLKKNDSIYNHFIQIRQSGIRVKKAKYFPTLVAISQIPIYGKEKRYITPRECARLQSFPDTFKLHNEDSKSYKQLGNSVNVDNVKTIIDATLSHYNLK